MKRAFRSAWLVWTACVALAACNTGQRLGRAAGGSDAGGQAQGGAGGTAEHTGGNPTHPAGGQGDGTGGVSGGAQAGLAGQPAGGAGHATGSASGGIELGDAGGGGVTSGGRGVGGRLGAAGSPVFADVEAFSVALVEVTCSRLFECEPYLAESLGVTPDSCVAMLWDPFLARLREPGVALDEEGWSACVGNLQDATCEERIYDAAAIDPLDDRLRAALRPPCGAHGTLASGDPCIHDLQCASGYCRADHIPMQCGVCTDVAGLGDECMGDTALICQAGLRCNGTCTLPRAWGESCTQYTDCRLGMDCVDDRCDIGGMARALSLGLICSSDGVCEPMPVADEDEPCPGRRCKPGTFCDPTFAAPPCQPWRQEGDACDPLKSTIGSRCYVGLDCLDGTCVQNAAQRCASSKP